MKMIKAFIARHPTEAHLVKNLLELEGIAAEIKGESLYGALGGIAITTDTLPSVWIKNDSQAGKAMEVVEKYLSGKGSPDLDGKPWICLKCGETVESQFTSCWKCGADRYTGTTTEKPVQAGKPQSGDKWHHLIDIRVLYRYLIITSLILYIIWFFMPYFCFKYSIYDLNTLNAMSWAGYGGIFKNSIWLSYSFLFLYIITYWGLIYFKPWARSALVVLTVASLISAFISGITVQTAFSYALDCLLYIIDGSIITLSYFSNLSREFDKKTPN